jgi:hypothetical protein
MPIAVDAAICPPLADKRTAPETQGVQPPMLGLPSAQIGRQLGMAALHLVWIYGKPGVADRTEAAVPNLKREIKDYV